jgi:hypothetical protein
MNKVKKKPQKKTSKVKQLAQKYNKQSKNMVLRHELGLLQSANQYKLYLIETNKSLRRKPDYLVTDINLSTSSHVTKSSDQTFGWKKDSIETIQVMTFKVVDTEDFGELELSQYGTKYVLCRA